MFLGSNYKFTMRKKVICNWPYNLIFELQKTLATHYIYSTTHCNSIVVQSK